MEHAQSARETPVSTRFEAGRPGASVAPQRSPLRIAAAAFLVVFGFALVVAMFASSLTEEKVGGRDYIQYWASGRLLLSGANPYDPAAVFRLERMAGSVLTEPEISFSPPPVLSMSLVFAVFSARTGLILQFAALFASLCLSIRILWELHGRPSTLLHLLGFVFAPVLACIQAGQISIFFLLGVLLFLYFRDRFPMIAGAALLPCALKPHLFVPFGVVLVLWILRTKRYRILVGTLSALMLSCVVPFYLDRDLWSQYTQMMRTAGIMNHFAPTLGFLLRLWIYPRATWLQFVPEAAACVWAAWYFWVRRNRWDWMDQGLLLLLVSLLCRPYGWFFDESVLLPAVLTGMFRGRETGRSFIPLALAAGVALLELCLSIKVTSPFYMWTTPAWLACYLYATVKTQTAAVGNASPAATEQR